MANRYESMPVDYRDDVRLFPGRGAKTWVGVLFAAYLLVPAQWFWDVVPLVSIDGFWLNVLNYIGVFAIGALGLNLLTGYTGQVSLGHAVFMGVGAYFAAYAGSSWDWPFWLWLPGATALGFVVGALVGPFALRLRGNYLVVVTLGLVFVGDHVFRNWNRVTGGNTGTSATGADVAIGPVDFESLDLFGHEFSDGQGLFWVIWFFVAVVAIAVKNLVRTRPGRALQAIRDRDLAAEIIGVDLFTNKTMAFAVSSAIAALAGGLFAPLQGFINPVDFGLAVSIQFIAIIILGGMGTVYGPIVGALVLGGMPRIIERISRDSDLPGIGGDKGGPEGLVSVSSLNIIIYGLAIAAFLLAEPRGLAGIWQRIRNYLRSWPFSY